MTKIAVVSRVLEANDLVARANRERLDAAGIVAINILSAPGSGKTMLLERTIEALPDLPAAILVGDLQTTRDAERLAATGAPVVQINTGDGCHLTAEQVAEGLNRLAAKKVLSKIRLLFIENVGNMVCPAEVNLGEHRRVALLSLPEGDDKVAKYPLLFQGADVILLNKVDLQRVLTFSVARVKADLARVNTRAPLLPVSAANGAGLDAWCAWLRAQLPRR
jgi:hydrogenase nickel incorporation protein HypB